jgi:hypothetical protein
MQFADFLQTVRNTDEEPQTPYDPEIGFLHLRESADSVCYRILQLCAGQAGIANSLRGDRKLVTGYCPTQKLFPLSTWRFQQN